MSGQLNRTDIELEVVQEWDAKLDAAGGTLTGPLNISAVAPIIQLEVIDTQKKYFLVVDGNSFSLRQDNLQVEPYPLLFNNGLYSLGNEVLHTGNAVKTRIESGKLQYYDGEWKDVAISAIKSIQRGSVEFSATTTVTINAVDMAKSVVITSGDGLRYASGGAYSSFGRLNSATELYVHSPDARVEWQVIEYV